MAEEKKIRRIGILTSGGDAPGMNAAIKAVVDKAYELNINVVGIVGGYSGLMAEPEPELEEMLRLLWKEM